MKRKKKINETEERQIARREIRNNNEKKQKIVK